MCSSAFPMSSHSVGFMYFLSVFPKMALGDFSLKPFLRTENTLGLCCCLRCLGEVLLCWEGAVRVKDEASAPGEGLFQTVALQCYSVTLLAPFGLQGQKSGIAESRLLISVNMVSGEHFSIILR